MKQRLKTIGESITTKRFPSASARKEFDDEGKVHFHASDEAEMSIFYKLCDILKREGVEYGETNITPEQYTIYDPNRFDSSLRRVKGSTKNEGRIDKNHTQAKDDAHKILANDGIKSALIVVISKRDDIIEKFPKSTDDIKQVIDLLNKIVDDIREEAGL